MTATGGGDRDPAGNDGLAVEVTGGGLSLWAAARSERGTVRESNQDRVGLIRVGDGSGIALVLADGMGGQAGGGEAAEAATEAAGFVLRDAPLGAGALRAAAEAATRAVAAVRSNLGGQPGTTLVMAAIGTSGLTVANIGDSRAYLIRQGKPTPLTDDHSWVAEEVRAGRLPAAATRGDPRRNIVTRAVLGDDVVPDVTTHRVQDGDLVLLCSDGVWEPLEDATIAELTAGDAPLQARLRWLLDAALNAGSRDNVSVAAVQVRAI